MVVLCDDNETYDDALRPEAHASLPLELRYDYSKLIDRLSNLVICVTSLAEKFKKIFRVTNALYNWHVAQNHFSDTRGQHHYCGRVTLYTVTPLMSYKIPASSLSLKDLHTSFDFNAFEGMYHHSWEMCDWIYDLYLYPNDFLDTHYNWDAARAILLATCPSPSNEFPVATLNSKSCTSLDSNARKLRIQPEPNERLTLLDSHTHTPDTTMPDPIRTQIQVENQPKPKHVPGPGARPCSYQDFLDALFLLETRFTVLYEHCKLEHEMAKEMYEWHLSQNHFTEKSHVILSKL